MDIKNPVHITRLEIGKTKAGQTVINAYRPPLQYPILQIHQPDILIGAGIDPNAITAETPHYCDILITWEEATNPDGTIRRNKNGNAYLNATSATAAHTDATAQAIEALTAEIATIKHLIAYLAEQQAGGRDALIAWYKERTRQEAQQ